MYNLNSTVSIHILRSSRLVHSIFLLFIIQLQFPHETVKLMYMYESVLYKWNYRYSCVALYCSLAELLWLLYHTKLILKEFRKPCNDGLLGFLLQGVKQTSSGLGYATGPVIGGFLYLVCNYTLLCSLATS